MSKDNRENFHEEELEYSFVSLLSNKLRIGVIGGGKAGFIKIKHFINTGCYVEVISKKFNKEIIDFVKYSNDKLKLIKEDFDYDFIKDKHIVLITIDDINLVENIRTYCENNFKIVIDSTDFTKGTGVVPIQKKLKNLTFALNTKGGNPKGALFLSNKIDVVLKEYDDFIGFTTSIRNAAKKLYNYKKEIINFVVTEDFKYFYDKQKSDLVLNMYFSQDVVKALSIKTKNVNTIIFN